jgi:hypothetical protein
MSRSSWWSRLAGQLLGHSERRARRRPRPTLGRGWHTLERLEGRAVLSANFGYAANIGNEVGQAGGTDVAVDASGATLMTGFFTGTIDLAPNATRPGDGDILVGAGYPNVNGYVAKYATDGSLLWATGMLGPDASASASTVTTDAAGNVYVGGAFTGTISIGATSLTSDSAGDAFLAKLGSDGAVQWAVARGGADKQNTGAIEVDGSGAVYRTGGTSTYDANGATVSRSIQIDKLDATGRSIWSKEIAAATGGTLVSEGIGVDGSGSVYVGGTYRGTIDFDPSPTKRTLKSTNDTSYVLKLTSAGAYSWASEFVNRNLSARNRVRSLEMSAAGNIVVGGSYLGSVDFQPNRNVKSLPYETSGGNVFGGGFIGELSPSGVLNRVQRVGAGFANVYDIAMDAAGAIYTTGMFQGADTIGFNPDFDPGPGTDILASNGYGDIFVAKYTSTGAYQWAKGFGNTGSSDAGKGIAVDANGAIYVTGSYYGNVDFNPSSDAVFTLDSGKFVNGFLLKWWQV